MALTIRKSALEPSEYLFRIGRVSTFVEALERLPRDPDSTYLFRGHGSFTYLLIPKLYRDKGWIANEDVLFKELVLRCPNEFASVDSTFQALVRMQHYSLPTRLLDVTSNPLIALYFACEQSSKHSDAGEVVVLKVPTRELKYFDSDTVSVLANISQRPATFNVPIKSNIDIKSFNKRKEVELLLHEIRKEKPYFLPRVRPDDLHRVVCVKPKLDNARIIRQDGAFLLFGMGASKSAPALVPSAYVPSLEGGRWLVKNSEKKALLKQLAAMGITQSTIFPEMDKGAEHIMGIYSAPDA